MEKKRKSEVEDSGNETISRGLEKDLYSPQLSVGTNFGESTSNQPPVISVSLKEKKLTSKGYAATKDCKRNPLTVAPKSSHPKISNLAMNKKENYSAWFCSEIFTPICDFLVCKDCCSLSVCCGDMSTFDCSNCNF